VGIAGSSPTDVPTPLLVTCPATYRPQVGSGQIAMCRSTAKLWPQPDWS